MGAGVSHAALGLHEYQQEQVVPMATEVSVVALPVERSSSRRHQLRRVPEHLVTESLVKYLSPSEIDAFLLTCHEYYTLAEVVWRMRWQCDELEAAREAGGYTNSEEGDSGATTGTNPGSTSSDGDGESKFSGAADETDVDPNVAAAIAASLQDMAQASGGGHQGTAAIKSTKMTDAVPDPDFIEDSALKAQTKTHRRRVFDAWLRRGKTFIGTEHTKLVRIMHGNNTQYWQRHQPSRESLSGAVAVCKTVCWFDLAASYHVKGPGRYVVSVRVKLSSSTRIQENFNLSLQATGHSCVVGSSSASTCGEADAASTTELKPSPTYYEGELAHPQWRPDDASYSTACWKNLIFGTIDIGDPLGAKITARMWKHSGSWVGGLHFDFIHVQDEVDFARDQQGRKGRRRRRSAKQNAAASVANELATTSAM